MEITRLVVFLVAMSIGFVAAAVSPLREFNAKAAGHLPLIFDIRSARLASGEIQFVVKITEGRGKLRKPIIAQIRTVHVNNGSDLAKPVRELPVEWDDGSLTCVFTITDKELEDPELSFYFGMPALTMPNIEHYYAPLKNFMKP